MANIWEKLGSLVVNNDNDKKERENATNNSSNITATNDVPSENRHQTHQQDQISKENKNGRKVNGQHYQCISKMKKIHENDLFSSLKEDSREYKHDILHVILQSYKNQSTPSFHFSRPYRVQNNALEKQFLEKKAEFQQKGYSQEEMKDIYGFLLIDDPDEVERMCRDGCMMANREGSNEGFQLCPHADLLKPSKLSSDYIGYLIIFKIMKGRVKEVVKDDTRPPVKSTPLFDSHVVINAYGRCSQICLYEYQNGSFQNHPRHVLPFAVVTVSLKPLSRKTQNKSTSNDDELSKTSVKNENHGIKEEEKKLVVWNGPLTIKGLYPCYVNMISSASGFTPVGIGQGINITHKMNASKAKQMHLKNIGKLRRKTDDLWGHSYVSVCELHLCKPDGKRHFEKMILYLGKHDCVAVQKLEKDVTLLLLTQGELANELGLTTVQQNQALLYCLFLRKSNEKKDSHREESSKAIENHITQNDTDISLKDHACKTEIKQEFQNESVSKDDSSSDHNNTIIVTVNIDNGTTEKDKASTSCDMELCETEESNILIPQSSKHIDNSSKNETEVRLTERSAINSFCPIFSLSESVNSSSYINQCLPPPKLDSISSKVNAEILELPPDLPRQRVTNDNYITEYGSLGASRTADNYVVAGGYDDRHLLKGTPDREEQKTPIKSNSSKCSPETPTIDEQKLMHYYTSPNFDSRLSGNSSASNISSYCLTSHSFNHGGHASADKSGISVSEKSRNGNGNMQVTSTPIECTKLNQPHRHFEDIPLPLPALNLSTENLVTVTVEESPPLPDEPPPEIPPPPPLLPPPPLPLTEQILPQTSVSVTTTIHSSCFKSESEKQTLTSIPSITSFAEYSTISPVKGTPLSSTSISSSPEQPMNLSQPKDNLESCASVSVTQTSSHDVKQMDNITPENLTVTARNLHSLGEAQSVSDLSQIHQLTSDVLQTPEKTVKIENLHPLADAPLTFRSTATPPQFQLSTSPTYMSNSRLPSVYQVAFQSALTRPGIHVRSPPPYFMNQHGMPKPCLLSSPSRYQMCRPQYRLPSPMMYRGLLPTKPEPIYDPGMVLPNYNQPVQRPLLPNPSAIQPTYFGTSPPPFFQVDQAWRQRMQGPAFWSYYNNYPMHFMVNAAPNIASEIQHQHQYTTSKIDNLPQPTNDIPVVTSTPQEEVATDLSTKPQLVKSVELTQPKEIPLSKSVEENGPSPKSAKCTLVKQPIVFHTETKNEKNVVVNLPNISQKSLLVAAYSDISDEMETSKPLVPYSDIQDDDDDDDNTSKALEDHLHLDEIPAVGDILDILEKDNNGGSIMHQKICDSILESDDAHGTKFNGKTEELKNNENGHLQTAEKTCETSSKPETIQNSKKKCDISKGQKTIQVEHFDSGFMASPPKSSMLQPDKVKNDFKDQKKIHDLHQTIRNSSKFHYDCSDSCDKSVDIVQDKLRIKSEPDDDLLDNITQLLDFNAKNEPIDSGDDINDIDVFSKYLNDTKNSFSTENSHDAEMMEEEMRKGHASSQNSLSKSSRKSSVAGLKHSLDDSSPEKNVTCKKIKLENQNNQANNDVKSGKNVKNTMALSSVPVVDLTSPVIDLTQTPSPIRIVKTVSGYKVDKSRRRSSEGKSNIDEKVSQLNDQVSNVEKKNVNKSLFKDIQPNAEKLKEAEMPVETIGSDSVNLESKDKTDEMSKLKSTSKENESIPLPKSAGKKRNRSRSLSNKRNQIRKTLESTQSVAKEKDLKVTKQRKDETSEKKYKAESEMKDRSSEIQSLCALEIDQISDKKDKKSDKVLNSKENMLSGEKEAKKQNMVSKVSNDGNQKMKENQKKDAKIDKPNEISSKSPCKKSKETDKKPETPKKNLPHKRETSGKREKSKLDKNRTSKERDHRKGSKSPRSKDRASSKDKKLEEKTGTNKNRDGTRNSRWDLMMKNLDADSSKRIGLSGKRKDSESESDSKSVMYIAGKKSKTKQLTPSKKSSKQASSSNGSSKASTSPGKQLPAFGCGISLGGLTSFKIPKLSKKRDEKRNLKNKEDKKSTKSSKNTNVSRSDDTYSNSHDSVKSDWKSLDKDNKIKDDRKSQEKDDKGKSERKSEDKDDKGKSERKSQEKEDKGKSDRKSQEKDDKGKSERDSKYNVQKKSRFCNNIKSGLNKTKSITEIMGMIENSLSKAKEIDHPEMTSCHIPSDSVTNSPSEGSDHMQDLLDVMNGDVPLEVIDEVGTDNESLKGNSTLDISDEFGKDLSCAIPVYGSRTKHLSGDSRKIKSLSASPQIFTTESSDVGKIENKAIVEEKSGDFSPVIGIVENNQQKDLNDNVVSSATQNIPPCSTVQKSLASLTCSSANVGIARPIVIVDPMDFEEPFTPSVDRKVEEIKQGNHMRITIKNDHPLHKLVLGYTLVELIKTSLHGKLEDQSVLCFEESLIHKSVSLTLHKLNIASSVERRVNKNDGDFFSSIKDSKQTDVNPKEEVLIPGLGDLDVLERTDCRGDNEAGKNEKLDVKKDNKGVVSTICSENESSSNGEIEKSPKLEESIKKVTISPIRGPQTKEKEKEKLKENSNRGPIRSSTARSHRQDRQHHPYTRKEKRYKSGWSFDIEYTLDELMQNLSACIYKERCRTTTPTSTKPRFSNYRFRRSSVPEFLPDERDELDLTRDAIPDFDERRQRADLLDTLITTNDEDEHFTVEQTVYDRDAEPQREESKIEPVDEGSNFSIDTNQSVGVNNDWEIRVQDFIGKCSNKPTLTKRQRKRQRTRKYYYKIGRKVHKL